MEFTSPLATDYHLDNLVCDVLVSTERYHLKREEISKTLSDGFFSLSRARKSKQSYIASPDDIRNDIESSIRLITDREDGAGPYTLDEDLTNERDPLLMICALPPPPLKNAKKEFQHIVMLCNSLISDTYQIMKTCESIEVWQGTRTEDNCPYTEACKVSGTIKQKKLAFEGEGEEETQEEPVQQDVKKDSSSTLRQRPSNVNKKPVAATTYGESDDFNYKVADLSTDEEDEDD